MTAKNDITGDLIKSKPSDTYADNYDAIFRKPKELQIDVDAVKASEVAAEFMRLALEERDRLWQTVNVIYK